MESQSLRSVVRRLRQVVAPPAVGGPDAELVRAFAVRGDAHAFEQIVRRHGPMVLGVCQRVLRDAADADDAFQATFLVLVRKAASLRQPERLGAWLHQVAHRTARKLRAIRLARQARETELSNVWLGEPPADIVWRELRPVFDQELDLLPEKLRLPAVLCFLEGHSKRDAARTLGWPEGTLAGRLQQARERLRIRFAARGLTLSAGALAVALFEGVGSAALPDRLLASTIQLAAMGPAGAVASAGVRVLADGVSQAMVMTKVKALAATVLVAGMVGTGTGVVLVPGSGPGVVVAADSPKEPVKKDQPYDAKEGRKQIDKAIEDSVIGELRIKNLNQRAVNEHKGLVAIVDQHILMLRAEIERITPLVMSGWVQQTELDKLNKELRDTEAQRVKMVPRPAKDPERDALEAELAQLKDRADFEERMVKKGFMTDAQVKKTRAEIARAEAALANWDARKAPDPRRAAMEELIRKMEQIVETTRDGVRKGAVPQSELLNAEKSLLEYKLKLLELPDRPPASRPAANRDLAGRVAMEETIRNLEKIVEQSREGVRKGIVPTSEFYSSEATLQAYKVRLLELTDPPSAKLAIEELIRKMEQIVEATRDGVRKGIVSQSELLNAEKSLLEYKFKLLELPDRAPQTKPAANRKPVALDQLLELEQKEAALERAEALFKQSAVSLQEIRRLRAELSRIKAEVAEKSDDYAAALKHREAVVGGSEAELTDAKKLFERSAISRGEVRAIEVSVAEAKVEAHRTAVRKHLAEIVAAREQELKEAKTLFDIRAISAEEVHKAEQALTLAKLRLSECR